MGVDGPGASSGTTNVANTTGAGLGALAAAAKTTTGVASPARSMSDDEAAVAIQSTYRGYKTRKSGLGQDFRLEATNALMERQSKTRIAEMQGVDPYAATRSGDGQGYGAGSGGFGGSRGRLPGRLDEARAATMIQATFRGHATRREFQKKMTGFGTGGLTAYRRKNIGGRQLYLSGDAHGDGPMTTFGDDNDDDGGAVPTGGSGGWEPHGLGLKQWEHFAARQHARHVSPAPDGLCLLYTSPSPRDATLSRMPSSA